jgi:diacylglycerol kinase (ATP)
VSRQVALLVNPTSGKGRGGRYAPIVAKALQDAGFHVSPLAGRDAREALDLARQAVAQHPDALVVIGGDGMVNLGLQAVAGTDVPLGLIPAGTGNDFARLLNIPRGQPEQAAAIVVDWNVRTVDAGRAAGRWFAGVLSSGFDSAVNERGNRMRWPKGRSRYNLAILAELGVFRPAPYRIVLDGTVVEREAMLVAVGNGVSYGGGMKVAPHARLDDGELAVTVLKSISKLEFLRVFPKVYSGRHVEHRAVEVYSAKTVELEADGMTAYADGERFGSLPITAECVPNAWRVLATPSL